MRASTVHTTKTFTGPVRRWTAVSAVSIYTMAPKSLFSVLIDAASPSLPAMQPMKSILIGLIVAGHKLAKIYVRAMWD